jgi:hypothetical protein
MIHFTAIKLLKETRTPDIYDWCNKHAIKEFLFLHGKGRTFDSTVTDLSNSRRAELIPQDAKPHSLINYHKTLLQSIANETECEIHTAMTSNNLLCNYFSWNRN